MKVCRACNEEKDETEFYKTKNKSYPDSLLHQCKKCISDYRKQRKVQFEKPTYKFEKKEIIMSFD
jgi:hypothetical protein